MDKKNHTTRLKTLLKTVTSRWFCLKSQHYHVSQNRQCQRWCDSALSCVFIWNPVILTCPCHHFTPITCTCKLNLQLQMTQCIIQTLAMFFCLSTKRVQDRPPTHKKKRKVSLTLLDSRKPYWCQFCIKHSIKMMKLMRSRSKVSPQTSGVDVFVFDHL